MEQIRAGDPTAGRRGSKRPRRTRILDATIRGRQAWTRANIRREDFVVPVGPDVLCELSAFIDTLRRNPLQTELLSPEDHALPRARALMRAVRRVLESGVGFAYDGEVLKVRFNHRNIVAGHDLAGEPLDDEGGAAIDALTRILESRALRLDFDVEAGQIFYTMNWRIAHSRTGFEDHAAADRRRHLVRIFLRDRGARTYDG